MKNTAVTFKNAKQKGEKLSMLTAYDYTTASLVDSAGINAILVGDSLGMVMLGYEDTLSVTMEDMIHHSKAVARGAKNTLVVTDMPFMSYQTSVYDAVINAGRLMKEGRAGAVKLEGGAEFAEHISAIVKASIPVMGHIGLTPQSVNAFGGFKVQGKTNEAAGEGDSNNYESITYEGYGPSGVALIVETLTDNRNRTAGDLRHYFDKFGGNMGTPGCVSFMFSKKGVILIESEGLEEDTVMEDALDAGAADFSAEDGVFEVQTEPDDFSAVRDALEEKGYTFVSAEVEMVPSTYTKLTDEEAITKMQRLLDVLEDNDDVQNVFHNWEYDEPEEDE